LRINRGKLKSRRFSVPKSFPSRPTTDFAKEGLFNTLENRIAFHQLKILDLCTGTGNISFEFASREAGKIIAVDSNYNCVRFVSDLAKELEVSEDIQVVKSDAVKYIQQCGSTFDIIFADPPYAVDFHLEMVNIVFERNLLSEFGWLIVEHGKETDLSQHPNFVDTKKYSNVHFSFFKQIT
jgi:16S rRNA (guanine(966)-N(2))-methyltransferase RsmD